VTCRPWSSFQDREAARTLTTVGSYDAVNAAELDREIAARISGSS
jgi:uncharacterized protein with GYD domain